MRQALLQNRTRIDGLCVEYGVRRLELFGSAAKGEFRAGASDVDFLVEFEDGGWEGSFRRYMGLKLGLEDLLGVPVDLVEPKAITNVHFLKAIVDDRQVIYEA